MNALKSFAISHRLEFDGDKLPTKNGFFFSADEHPGKIGLQVFFDPGDHEKAIEALKLSGVCRQITCLECEPA